MPIVETLVQDVYSHIEGAWSPAGLLSDSNVTCITRKPNGANWDFEVWLSEDAGSTYALKLTFTTNSHSAVYTYLIGDKWYCVRASATNNVALTFWRIDYNSATKSFSVAINGATIRGAVATEFWASAGIDIEPGGRVWCGYVHGDAGGNRGLNTSYSDNDGSSWTSTTLNGILGITGSTTGVMCLEFNTIFVNYWAVTGNWGVTFVSRKHVDSPNTYGAQTWLVDTADVTGYCHVARQRVATPKRGWIAIWDQAAGAQTIYARRVVESGDGTTLDWSGLQSTAVPGGQSGFVWPSARTDGCVFHYLFSGSLTTLRTRSWADGSTNWDGELTTSLAVACRSFAASVPALFMNSTLLDGQLLVMVGRGTAGNFRVSILAANMGPPPETYDRAIPLLFRGQPEYTRAIPLGFRGTSTYDRVIPLGFASVQEQYLREFPLLFRAAMEYDRTIPLLFREPAIETFDRTIPLAWRIEQAFDRQIPLSFSALAEWAQAGADGDIWVKDGVAADVWVKDGVNADAWVKS